MARGKQRSTGSFKPSTPAIVALDAFLKSVNTPSNIKNLVSVFLVLFMLLTIPILVISTINQRDLRSLAETPTCTNLASLPDETAPSVAIENPTEGDYLRETSLLIEIKATDDICVKKVSLLIDGQIVKAFIAPPYIYSWDLREVKAGNHTISVRAADAVNNISVTSITAYRSAKSFVAP